MFLKVARYMEAGWNSTSLGMIFLATNSLPQINNTDNGIWRRIHAIPFTRTFTAEQQDKDLGIKLTAELPGILNWAIKGCLEWQETGTSSEKSVANRESRSHFWIKLAFIEYRRATCATETPATRACAQIKCFSFVGELISQINS